MRVGGDVVFKLLLIIDYLAALFVRMARIHSVGFGCDSLVYCNELEAGVPLR